VIALIGEAWGEKEEEIGRPFVGTSGWILDQLLSQVGVRRQDCFVSNVFNLRPRPSNDIKNLCGPRAAGIAGMPALQPGKFILARYASELDRLYDEIRREQPNVVVALGATASWALLHSTGIKGIRGSVSITAPAVSSACGRPFKVLPTYHPAAVSRQWNLRPIVVADLDKAKRESGSPEYVRPSRSIWIRPDLSDLQRFEELHLAGCERLSCDIETREDQITCIGFAPSPSVCLVSPFWTEGGSYWNRDDELTAWLYVRRWLARYPTVFQNGLYDINFLWSRYGIPVPHAAEDTMLLHHAFQPEMEKGLGFLASIYTEEGEWKSLRKGMKHD
jgi:uracil-DNA glycosylase